ncbi:hypothetical protein BsWGS_08168 [Bradybaena similaris]
MELYWALLSAQICFLVLPAESRQMCWVCQYVQNGQGRDECALHPGNWTGGEPRLRCQYRCIISAEFDKLSGNPTFIYRGCAETKQKDGCQETAFKHVCFYSCDSKHYCNDKQMGISPLLLDSDTSARPTTHILPLIAVAVCMILFLHLRLL